MTTVSKSCLMGAITLISINLLASPAFAGWGKFTVTDGEGDGVQVKHHLFGQKSVVAKDQLGDSYIRTRGLLGINRETEGSLLGNSVDVKHGLLSGKSVKAHDYLGDSVESKKTFFGLGPRNTTVDVHGMSGLVGGLLHGNSAMRGPDPFGKPMASQTNPGSMPASPGQYGAPPIEQAPAGSP